MDDKNKKNLYKSARDKFLALSLESTRKSYYPQLQNHLEKAKENERRLQLLIDNMPAQISYINSQERYVSVNREFEKEFGQKRSQIIGKRLETIIGTRIYTQVKPHIDSALSGKSEHFEFSIDTKNKGTRWFEVNYVSEKDNKENVSGFYVLTIEVTQKKETEKEQSLLKDRLRQAQKMEAIGTLSGGIAHDFNNILSGIFGYTQLADAHINNPGKAKEYIEKIFEGAKRASFLIQQILTFSRQTKYSKQTICFFNVLMEVLKLIRSTIPSNIEIREFLNSKAMILADSTQIHQLIMNLCTNAYHAMGDNGGIMTIKLDEITLTDDQMKRDSTLLDGRYLKLEIRDTGKGIDPQIIDRIFDPYFTTKTIGKGTGLGLAVVNGIVKKHNGFIEVDSNLGTGTVFQVYLPVVEAKKISDDLEKVMEESITGSEKIMVVDDEIAILETLEEILSRQGYEISVFLNGESALQEFVKDPDRFDLIITDMTMPKMTGDKLSMEVLKARPDIPIIICTGYHENFTENEAIGIGIKKYFQKPLVISELSKSIRDLLKM